MEYSDEELIEIVEEIDAMSTEVSAQDANFINGLLERSDLATPDNPIKLTPRQRAWIIDMQARYLT